MYLASQYEQGGRSTALQIQCYGRSATPLSRPTPQLHQSVRPFHQSQKNEKRKEEKKHTLAISIQLANHNISRMANNRTKDARNIAPQKAHPGLRQHPKALLRPAQRPIKPTNRLLKRRELGHRVRNLTSPQRRNALIETPQPLLSRNLPPALAQGARVGRQGSLHADLDSLEGAEGHVGEELGGGARAEEDERAVRVREELLAVEVLEVLVEAVFAGSLEGVAHEGGGPAEEDAAEAFFGEDGAPCGEVGGVDFGVDLAAAFDEVEGGD